MGLLFCHGVSERVPFEKLTQQLSKDEIISRVSGKDNTTGSCVPSAFCYIGNKAGYDVFDFRGGKSLDFFSKRANLIKMSKLAGVESYIETNTNDFIAARGLFSKMQKGKEYQLAIGRHRAIIRKVDAGLEFLEMQSSKVNGWKPLNDFVLEKRFGCQKSHFRSVRTIIVEANSLGENEEYRRLLGYINTAKNKQVKGATGNVK